MQIPGIRVVLIETSHPGNIGAAARAMKTMGLSSLYLVNPHQFPCAEATARASGADDVLMNATICGTLVEALTGCKHVFGASARLRAISWPMLDPKSCADRVVDVAGGDGDVALVFGREHSGLSNEELDKCQYLVNIPANPEYQSLNLAAAVQILAYEVRMAVLKKAAVASVAKEGEDESLVSSEELEGYYQHMEKALLEIGFFKPPNYRKLTRRLRGIYNRVGLTKTELNILHGILSCAEGRKYQWLKQNLGSDQPPQTDDD